ncbi:MAG: hypothetical protein HY361_03255 [Candidatus Aenigmarchaeota archaeon]|nr:hypothetical protein [Candidatus Aenigmarchaeota archaeon]
MVLELIFSLLLTAVIVYIAIRLFHSIVLGTILIVAVFFASYLIVGAFPDLKSVPIIGPFLNFPSTIGEAMESIRNVFFNIDVISTARDSESNLLITVTNTGLFDAAEFKVSVDNRNVSISNNPKDPLKYKETTTIQTDWKGNFTYILVETKQAKATYKQ